MDSTQTEAREPAEETARVRALLRERGVKCTTARLLVLQTLGREPASHLGAAEIRRRITAGGGHLDVSTVYRTLERLVDLDLLHRLEAGGTEAVYGRAGGGHDHAVCEGCGAVADLAVPGLEAALKATEFQIRSLIARGLCPACQAA
jgi:Fur family ferric uptake transcriptional regulator